MCLECDLLPKIVYLLGGLTRPKVGLEAGNGGAVASEVVQSARRLVKAGTPELQVILDVVATLIFSFGLKNSLVNSLAATVMSILVP